MEGDRLGLKAGRGKQKLGGGIAVVGDWKWLTDWDGSWRSGDWLGQKNGTGRGAKVGKRQDWDRDRLGGMR